ncbi:MAG TPA: hypothetical protein VFS15_26225, partial [Kofleriaceae bacterium]|nr:hypothetical protein [Kofleriaceae bacterium]
MKRVLSAAVLSLVVGGAGCTTKELTAEDLEYSTVNFTPDFATGNVETWWYELSYDGGSVVACNSNGNYYDPTGWYFDDYDTSIRVYFGAEWENYTFYDMTD